MRAEIAAFFCSHLHLIFNQELVGEKPTNLQCLGGFLFVFKGLV